MQVSAEEAYGKPLLTKDERRGLASPHGFWNRIATKLFRRQAIRRLGAACVTCGYSKDVRALQLDHVNGDGHLESNHTKFYQDVWVGRRDKDIQVLCANCNAIKRVVNKEDLKRRPCAGRRPNGWRKTVLDNTT